MKQSIYRSCFCPAAWDRITAYWWDNHLVGLSLGEAAPEVQERKLLRSCAAADIVECPSEEKTELMALLERAEPGPTGILYLPYLSGSNAPLANPEMTGAFLGLRKHHGKTEILKAVLEGVSYDLEWIRQQAVACFGTEIDTILCVGGGTRNAHWMQIKADLSGCEIQSPQLREATLTGAAWIAASRCDDCLPLPMRTGSGEEDSIPSYHPDAGRHKVYQRIFHTRYLPVQEPLRRILGTGGVDHDDTMNRTRQIKD